MKARVAATTGLIVVAVLASGLIRLAHGAPPAPAGTRPAVAAPPAREALAARLQDILSRPDYRQAKQGGRFDPGAASRWLWLQIARILGRLGGLHETNYGLFLFALITGIAVLIPILAHITYTVVQFLRRRGVGGEGPGDAAPAAAPTSPSDLVRQAEAHAGAGRYREAVRSLYLAMIRELQVRGLLPRTASQTNWEHLAQLRSAPNVSAYVRPFTQVFDEKWYGGRPSSAEDVAQCRGWLEAVRREVETP